MKKKHSHYSAKPKKTKNLGKTIALVLIGLSLIGFTGKYIRDQFVQKPAIYPISAIEARDAAQAVRDQAKIDYYNKTHPSDTSTSNRDKITAVTKEIVDDLIVKSGATTRTNAKGNTVVVEKGDKDVVEIAKDSKADTVHNQVYTPAVVKEAKDQYDQVNKIIADQKGTTSQPQGAAGGNNGATGASGGACPTNGSPVLNGTAVATGGYEVDSQGNQQVDPDHAYCRKCNGGSYDGNQLCKNLLNSGTPVALPTHLENSFKDSSGNLVTIHKCFASIDGANFQVAGGTEVETKEGMRKCNPGNGILVDYAAASTADKAKFDNSLQPLCSLRGQVASDGKCVAGNNGGNPGGQDPPKTKCGPGFTPDGDYCKATLPGDRMNEINAANKLKCGTQPYDPNTGLCQAPTFGKPRECTAGPSKDGKSFTKCTTTGSIIAFCHAPKSFDATGACILPPSPENNPAVQANLDAMAAKIKASGRCTEATIEPGIRLTCDPVSHEPGFDFCDGGRGKFDSEGNCTLASGVVVNSEGNGSSGNNKYQLLHDKGLVGQVTNNRDDCKYDPGEKSSWTGQYLCPTELEVSAWQNGSKNTSSSEPPKNSLKPGEVCSSDDACASERCTQGIKPGGTEKKWYCISNTNSYPERVYLNDAHTLYKGANGDNCTGNNSKCASGFCEIRWAFIPDVCADNPFIDPTTVKVSKTRAEQQIENNQNKYGLIITKDPEALVEFETSLAMCEKEHGENSDSEINCVQVPGRPFVYVPKEAINDLANDLGVSLKKPVNTRVNDPNDCDSGKVAIAGASTTGYFRCMSESFCPETNIEKGIYCRADGTPACEAGNLWAPGVDCDDQSTFLETSSLNTTSDPAAANPVAPVSVVTVPSNVEVVSSLADEGLGPNSFIYYSQRDDDYVTPEDGVSRLKLGKFGCGTTVAAMLLTNYTGEDMDPVETRNELFTHPNYLNQGFYFSDAILKLEGFGFDFEDLSTFTGQSRVIAQATYDNPIVVGFQYEGAENGHYVIAVGKDVNGNPLVYDPFAKKESGPTAPIALTLANYPGLDLSTADITLVHPPTTEAK